MIDSIATTRTPSFTSDRDSPFEAEWMTWICSRPGRDSTEPTGRVLLVAYQFPPTGGSGVYRPAALSRWLPTFGWEVEVLTAGHSRFPWHDDSLLAMVPETCTVHRVRGWEPACIADALTLSGCPGGTDAQGRSHDDTSERGQQGGWLRRYLQDRIYWRLLAATGRMGLSHGESLWTGRAVRHAVRQHRRAPFDAVISTGPPHVTHEVARRISRRLRIAWLADLRDPLISDFDRDDAETRNVQPMSRIEATVLNEADRIITTCPSLAEFWQRKYPHRHGDIIAITNGFNRSQIASLAPVVQHRENRICRFVAAGAFYGRREIARLIRPMEEVLQWRPEWRERVRLTIVGTLDAEQRQQWQHRAADWVELPGYVDRNTAMQLTARAACNILMVPECEHGRLSIPGKTFDLLALPVHLLALAPQGSDTERIVVTSGASTCVPPEATALISAAMERIVTRFLDGRLEIRREWSNLDCYDQRLMAQRFAACLAQISACEATEASIPAGNLAAAGAI